MMNRFFRTKWIRTLAIVLAALATTWAISAGRGTYQVAKMTEKMKTVCVGRMLIDLPAEATTAIHGASISGFDIEAFAESPEAFSSRVAAREAEIRAKPDRLGGSKNMESVREVKSENGVVGKIFVHGRSVTEGQSSDGFTIEHYRYEGVALEAHVHGDGISIDLSNDYYDPDRIENLHKMVAQLAANPGNRIPNEPGFCVDGAYVRDPGKAGQRERIVLSAGLPSWPDIEIRFDTLAGTKPASKGLLERNAASHTRAPAVLNMRFTNLRAAPRTIDGVTGDELVERVVEENFAIVYGFQWEVIGTESGASVPAVTLRMATGRGPNGPVQSSLAQPAALALWDKISSSIRVRPTATRRVTAVAPPSPSLGMLATAGDLCPHTGWWQCSEGGNAVSVLGGQRQFLRQGQRLPQALLLPPATLWQKVRGLQPSFESGIPTAWKLVDKRSRARVAPDVQLDQAKIAAPSGEMGAATFLGQASIGACVTTGGQCLASGWWRCEEPHAVDGTRWFAQGSLLPAATFSVPAGCVGKSESGTKLILRRAAWRLVRIVQTPESDKAS